MRRAIAAVLLVCLSLAATASAAGGDKLKVKPGVYDPDKTRGVDAAWVTKIGLPDAGGSNHGLRLVKSVDTTVDAAAGATVTGAEGEAATEFGFDIRNDSLCTGGSPRFNVSATDGFHFVGGCGNGTASAIPGQPDWKRVRFDPQNPGQAFPPIAPGATITGVSLILDEQGTAVVDNIDVNGALAGKPGN